MGPAVEIMASPVASHSCTFGTISNKFNSSRVHKFTKLLEAKNTWTCELLNLSSTTFQQYKSATQGTINKVSVAGPIKMYVLIFLT